jgi:hypothetical protein
MDILGENGSIGSYYNPYYLDPHTELTGMNIVQLQKLY